eukprot:m.91400 g.91400  ORF g.91400 m.91400 type:complete len:141 (-) comp8601_c0_seq3:583-1005(-)
MTQVFKSLRKAMSLRSKTKKRGQLDMNKGDAAGQDQPDKENEGTTAAAATPETPSKLSKEERKAQKKAAKEKKKTDKQRKKQNKKRMCRDRERGLLCIVARARLSNTCSRSRIQACLRFRFTSTPRITPIAATFEAPFAS